MITKKTILLLLVFQICLIKESFGLNFSFENIVGGIKQIPSMATTIPPFLKNTLLPHSMRKTSLLFFTPCVINKLSDKNSKYEAMNTYFNTLLSTDEQSKVAEIAAPKKKGSEIIGFKSVETNPTQQKNWNHLKQSMKEDEKNSTIYNKMQYVESLFTSRSLDDSNIKMLQLDLTDTISFWKTLKIIAGKTFTDYFFLELPIILIALSIMGKEENKTKILSFVIPAIVAVIKIAHYNLLKKIYQKKSRRMTEEEEKKDLRFTLLSSRLKNPSTTSLLTIASIIFLFYFSKKSAAQ